MLDHHDLASRGFEHLRELGGDVATAEHREPPRRGVDAHDVVGGEVGQAGVRDRRRHGGATARGDDNPVAGDLACAVDFEAALAGEARLGGIHLDKFAVLTVLPAVSRLGIDAAEYPIAQHLPVQPGGNGSNAQFARTIDGVGEFRRVGKHLRWDAPSVEAGATERAGLDDGDVEMGKRLVDQHVAGPGAYDDQVVVGHDSSPICATRSSCCSRS